MAGETFTFGLAGSGNFVDPARWTPSVGAPPRSGQDQNLSIAGGSLAANGQPWDDYDVAVRGNGTVLSFANQTFGNAASFTQTAADATYAIDGTVNSFAEWSIGGAGAQATARFNLPGTTFFNNGPMEVDGNLLVTGFGAFINNSTITIENGVAQFQAYSSGSAAASVVIGENATLAYTGYGANSAISFETGETGRLLVGSPYAATSLRTIIGFDAGDSISLPGQGVAAQFQQAPATGGAPSGILSIGGPGGARLADIPFTGQYDPGAFATAFDPATGLTTITTTKVEAQPPTPPGPPSQRMTPPAVLTVADPVLDLEFHGYRDLTGRTVNAPNDITLTMTNLTIRDTALQRADFLDGSLVFDGSSPEGRYTPDLEASQIARMYYTVLGRAPEFSGEHYWVTGMDANNLSIRDLAPGFYTSPEFQARYGTNTTDQQFVGLLYQNVLGRPAEQAGIDFWTSGLARGVGRADVVLGISESYEHQAIRFNDIEAGGIRFNDQPFL